VLEVVVIDFVTIVLANVDGTEAGSRSHEADLQGQIVKPLLGVAHLLFFELVSTLGDCRVSGAGVSLIWIRLISWCVMRFR
jgi:hypothetical protein